MTTILAGVAASQSLTVEPLAQPCVPSCARRRSGLPVTPSTDTSWSPGLSTFAAGVPFSITATRLLATAWPLARNSTHTITNAITMFTTGPAMITTIRFHTFWL